MEGEGGGELWPSIRDRAGTGVGGGGDGGGGGVEDGQGRDCFDL